MSSKAVFCRCCVSLLLCKKRIANRKATIVHHDNVVDHKLNENAVAGRLSIPVVNISVTTKFKKVGIELATSL